MTKMTTKLVLALGLATGLASAAGAEDAARDSVRGFGVLHGAQSAQSNNGRFGVSPSAVQRVRGWGNAKL